MAIRALDWERRYSKKLVLTDTIVILLAVFGAQFIRYGIDRQDLSIRVYEESAFALNYTIVSAVLALGWALALSVFSTRDAKVFGVGTSEYKRVINATFATFGALAIIAFAFRSQIGRGYVFIALPAGLVLLLITRWLWRKRLQRQRRKGQHLYQTLIVGERQKSIHVAQQIQDDALNGFAIVGAVTETGTSSDLLPGIPVIGGYDDIIACIDRERIDTLIVTSADALAPEQLRRLNWELENRHIDFIVAASLTDVAGPRIHARPVSGLPLIHVDYPRFTGRKYFTKRAFDLLASGVLIVLFSPIMLIVALAVKLTSKGPIHYSQERIGLGGASFRMLKFRSMVVDADAQLETLQAQSEGNGVLFKMKNDPRVTPVGRFIRKYSLDELPQIVNVFKGDMSLVGPRPPLPREVEMYEDWVHRRLLVKPGITGLWQVSGRSNLSWDDSVRLDLYYVENWSLAGDLVILWRTVKTVIRPEGAY